MDPSANMAHSFEEARRWEIRQYREMTPDQRRAVARALRDRYYGVDTPDVREFERSRVR